MKVRVCLPTKKAETKGGQITGLLSVACWLSRLVLSVGACEQQRVSAQSMDAFRDFNGDVPEIR